VMRCAHGERAIQSNAADLSKGIKSRLLDWADLIRISAEAGPVSFTRLRLKAVFDPGRSFQGTIDFSLADPIEPPRQISLRPAQDLGAIGFGMTPQSPDWGDRLFQRANRSPAWACRPEDQTDRGCSWSNRVTMGRAAMP
jgi:hypothetical protein